MNDGYGIDLEAFTLAALQEFLTHGDLLPSHQVLRENLDTHFATLSEHGLSTVQELIDTLTTRKAVARFADETGIPVDYLTILRRHVRGYIPRPVNFDEIPGLDSQVVQRLHDAGIKHTKQFYEQARTHEDRTCLLQKISLTESEILELLQLTDLSRMGWVGPIGVRLFYDAGAHTVATLASFDPEDLYEQVLTVNAERQYTKVTLGRRDIALTVETAKKLPDAIEYD